MNTRARGLLVGLLLVANACVQTPFRAEVQHRGWAAAAAMIVADSIAGLSTRDVRDAAMQLAVPDAAVWDPHRALLLFDTLLARGARLHRDEQRIHALLRHHATRMAAYEARVVELTTQLEAASRAAEIAQIAYRTVVAELSAASDERVLLHRVLARLEDDLRSRELQIAALRSELDRLKAIDLGPPSRVPPP